MNFEGCLHDSGFGEVAAFPGLSYAAVAVCSHLAPIHTYKHAPHLHPGEAPRFFHPHPLPAEAGMHTCLEDTEAVHAAKSLRLTTGDALELCDAQVGANAHPTKRTQCLQGSVSQLLTPRCVDRRGGCRAPWWLANGESHR